jgi:hypothetical protein
MIGWPIQKMSVDEMSVDQKNMPLLSTGSKFPLLFHVASERGRHLNHNDVTFSKRVFAKR